ncbi:MAG: TolC family protein [Myxococcota bacterium]|nr:TolC family protein [Myxococcota bacterium]
MPSRTVSTFVSLLVLCLLAAPGHGQSTGGPIAAPALAPATGANTRPLSLADAIALGVQNNLGVEVNRYTPYVAQYESEAAWGAYNPLFESDIQYGRQREQNGFVTNQPTKSDQIEGGVGLTALIPYWGGALTLDFDGGKNNTTNPIERLSPKYNSGLTLGINAPLLRGLVWNEPWTQVKISRLGYESQLDNFTTSVMNTVFSIINDYWVLVARQEEVRVAEKSLESNNALLDQARVQYDVGVVSKVEVIQAEAGVANSEFNLILARNEYMNSQDQLIASVLGTQLHSTTTLLFSPTDNPVYTRAAPVDLEKSVERAFKLRPELAAAYKQVETGEISLRFAENQRLPRLDVNVRYRTLGTTGSENEVDSPFCPGGGVCPSPVNKGDFGDTFGYYYGQGGPDELSAVALVSIPLGNTTARKNASKARIQLRQSKSQITRLKQDIIVSVRRAARGLLASAQGVEAAERRRIAAAEQLRAEQIRLEHGESTPFDVLQRERDLVDAESQKIGALRAYRISQATLQREEGTILNDRNVVIDQVRALN